MTRGLKSLTGSTSGGGRGKSACKRPRRAADRHARRQETISKELALNSCTQATQCLARRHVRQAAKNQVGSSNRPALHVEKEAHLQKAEEAADGHARTPNKKQKTAFYEDRTRDLPRRARQDSKQKKNKKNKKKQDTAFYEDRTRDLPLTKRVLCQLS